VLFFNDTTRAIGAWRVEQGTVRGWFDYGTLADGWEVTQIGNFHGAGAEDIGFYNSITGTDGAWIMRSGAISVWRAETPRRRRSPWRRCQTGSRSRWTGTDQVLTGDNKDRQGAAEHRAHRPGSWVGENRLRSAPTGWLSTIAAGSV
jgi:hypothetical protein